MTAEHRDAAPGAALRVVVVDDHPVVRSGLVSLLDAQPDLCVVGEASSGPRPSGSSNATSRISC